VEINFQYARSDWADLQQHSFRRWLQRLQPLPPVGLAVYLSFFLGSLVFIAALLAYLGVAIWGGHAWYYQAGAALLLVVPAAIAVGTLVPSQNPPSRGLYHELVFWLRLEDGLAEAMRKKYDTCLRRQEEAGELNLSTEYACRLGPDGYELEARHVWPGLSEFNNQTNLVGWGLIDGLDEVGGALVVNHTDSSFLWLPASAFSDADGRARFAEAVRFYKADRSRACTDVAPT
jgi:hypothetical protein